MNRSDRYHIFEYVINGTQLKLYETFDDLEKLKEKYDVVSWRYEYPYMPLIDTHDKEYIKSPWSYKISKSVIKRES